AAQEGRPPGLDAVGRRAEAARDRPRTAARSQAGADRRAVDRPVADDGPGDRQERARDVGFRHRARARPDADVRPRLGAARRPARQPALPRRHDRAAQGDRLMPRRFLLGLIGESITQSLAPTLHEDALAAAGAAGHYHLMDLAELGPRASLERLVAAVRAAGFAGVNVTHPVKEAVIPLLDAVDPEAREIGAVNTVVVGADGRLTGHNTDRSGFRRAFAAA